MMSISFRASGLTRFISRPWSQYSSKTTGTGHTKEHVFEDHNPDRKDSKELIEAPEIQHSEQQTLPWLEEPADEVQTALSKFYKTIDKICILSKVLPTEEPLKCRSTKVERAYACEELFEDDENTSTSSMISSVFTPSIDYAITQSLPERTGFLRHFLLDSFFYIYSIPASSLSPLANQGQHEFFTSPYGAPCLMSSLHRDVAFYLCHIAMATSLADHEIHHIQEYVVEPCAALGIPVECMVELLQSYFWHQCDPRNLQKTLPRQLSALCRAHAVARKTRRLALAKQLASDEYIMLQVAESEAMCMVISSRIVSFGINVLGPGWIEEFGHVLGTACVDVNAKNFTIDLQKRLAGETEKEKKTEVKEEDDKNEKEKLDETENCAVYHSAKLRREREGQKTVLQKEIEARAIDLKKHIAEVL